jgi:hypothetical protein
VSGRRSHHLRVREIHIKDFDEKKNHSTLNGTNNNLEK